MKSAILGVGTELTDGQIVNRNAAWLSEHLKELGPRTVMHLTVPDDRALILEALDACAAKADLIFITGGLGPTSDDFTRDLVAAWSGLPLEFDPESWRHLVDRLTARHYPVKEMQRQQCYFPKGAVILTNSQGTANGFRLRAKDRDLVVLPGPPREVEAIWNDHLRPWLNEKGAALDPVLTRSWDTVGLGESQVAELTEPLVQGLNGEVGYRVHLPYVEVKLNLTRSEWARNEELLTRIESVLGPHTIARDGEDLAREVARRWGFLTDVAVVDEVTGHILLSRLNEAWRPLWQGARWTLSSRDFDAGATTKMFLKKVDEHSVRVGFIHNRQRRETVIEAPMRAETMAERRKQYFAEMALLFWLRGP